MLGVILTLQLTFPPHFPSTPSLLLCPRLRWAMMASSLAVWTTRTRADACGRRSWSSCGGPVRVSLPPWATSSLVPTLSSSFNTTGCKRRAFNRSENEFFAISTQHSFKGTALVLKIEVLKQNLAASTCLVPACVQSSKRLLSSDSTLFS